MTPNGREASDENWNKATRIARELDRLLDGTEPMRDAVARAASELRLSTRQVYNHLRRYRDERRVSSLLPRTNGARRARISQAVEEIIAETLRELWLRPEQPDLAPIVEEIRARCASKGLSPPAYITVAKRIPLLFTPEEIARRRHSGGKSLRRLKPRPGYIRAKHALDVVQIDHTPADIQFVEIIDGQGIFVGRPYLTIAADVATSAIIGFCLTLEQPSRLSVALCLAQAMCRKEDWLAERNIDHAWPMFGRPKQIVVDSAMEFKSASFTRGCAEYGIAIRTRNKGTVHRGGLVERLLGKVNTVLRSLPGKTGRSIADRGDYLSAERAKLSFSDLERCIALAIIDHNLSQNARKLTVPTDEWERKRRVMEGPADNPMDVLLNFLPNTTRRISPQGISLFAIDYFDPWLGPLIARRDRLEAFDLRYDPRDMSHIYLRDPDTGAWRSVGRRDGLPEPITLWQHKAERSRLRETGRRPIEDRTAIRREIAATVDASTSQKQQMKALARARHAADAPKPYQSLAPSPAPARKGPARDRPRRVFPVEEW
ncbi:Mu transposase C-terminal domain-containing protein [Aliiroseovarius subalbicans]|uniref:Mu transposase C-terminal domain-containing protein n=1 Tax=Aliiroseovarius subalbicans TaxID=2925840 RepID=UPI001F5A2C0C|nr:Mu transposase C-terminal domain-containing protein [Aliiroseovarius subalbicans]MCI2400954.1 Mu transposase C-terminal domain-containing protein [Aliiroseovarius subalbicans]